VDGSDNDESDCGVLAMVPSNNQQSDTSVESFDVAFEKMMDDGLTG
jgi:hypothetical protein